METLAAIDMLGRDRAANIYNDQVGELAGCGPVAS